jgi:hypothetical protein
MFAFWPLGCFGNMESKDIAKVGRHLDRIQEINHAYTLKKTTASAAAACMYKEVEAIRERFLAIPESSVIKAPLAAFLGKWTSTATIEASLLDGGPGFMTEVKLFYMRGFVEQRDGWRTLFPVRRP